MAKKPNTAPEYRHNRANPSPPQRRSWCTTGGQRAIFCTHYFSVVGGAKLPDFGELERLALDHANRDGCNIRTHSTLLVDPAEIARGVAYRVVKGKLTKVRVAGRSPKSIALAKAKGR